MDTLTALGLVFGGSLLTAGFFVLAYAVRGIVRDNYKPRHTRSTYLPPKR